MVMSKTITLVCGMCGHTTTLFKKDWEHFLRNRASPASVMLCQKPSTVSGAKKTHKCLGVLEPTPNMFPG